MRGAVAQRGNFMVCYHLKKETSGMGVRFGDIDGGTVVPEVRDGEIDMNGFALSELVMTVGPGLDGEHAVNVAYGEPAPRPADFGPVDEDNGWYVMRRDFSHWVDGSGAEYDFSRPVYADFAVSPAYSSAYPLVLVSTKDELVAFQRSYREAALVGTVPDGLVVRLEADVDLAGVEWDSIGLVNGSTNNPSYAFKGTFDGQGHKIANMTLSDLSEGGTVGDVNNYRGFFGLVTDGVIKNLTVQGTGFGDTPPTGEYGCAMIVGRTTTTVVNGLPNPVLVENCVAEGSVAGTHNAAGIVVQACAGTFRNCVNRADVVCRYTKGGGLAAFAQGQSGKSIEVSFLGCVNEGAVTATDNPTKGGRDGIGGIVGYVNLLMLTISDCTNKGVVSRTDTALASAPVGQFVGQMSNYATAGGTNRALPGIRTVGVYTNTATSGGVWPSDWNYATAAVDSDGLVTLVSDRDVAPGGEYRVMMTPKTASKLSVPNATLRLDERLCTTTVASGADGYSVSSEKAFGISKYWLSKDGEETSSSVAVSALVAIIADYTAANAELEAIA